MDASTIIDRLHASITADNLSSETLAESLEEAAKGTLRSEIWRREIGASISVWNDLILLWDRFVNNICSNRGTDVTRSAALNAARLVRNLCAGGREIQMQALGLEPAFRKIIHFTTSFYQMQSGEYAAVLQTIVQALSNTLTGNSQTQNVLWPTYMALPAEENIITRLLGFSDARTITFTSVLILNCVKGSIDRSRILVDSTGINVCKALLQQASVLFEEQEDSEKGKAFEVCYEIFRNIFDLGLFPNLWQSLSSHQEILTPHQTTSLKFLDAYLQTPLKESIHGLDIISLLSTIHIGLCNEARSSLSGGGGNETNITVDGRLPLLIEAIILTAQSITSLLLGEPDTEEQISRLTHVKKSELDGGTVLGRSIDILRRLDVLLPRIILGKPQFPPNANPPMNQGSTLYTDPTGFAYIKRDLIRLIGILCHEDRSSQDIVRQFNGIQLVMNMCVVDERNPYLREHALFTLRNLLHNNPENQAVVDEFKPVVNWDAEGQLIA